MGRLLDENAVLEIISDNPYCAEGIVEDVKALPSAQPEIIHCGECKWYGRANKQRFYRGMDCLQRRMSTIVPDKDFCSKAERRTDGETTGD